MADKILNTRILLKYDTLENWNKSEGYLRAGEVAIATVPEGTAGQEVGSVKTPQVLVKVGDGKHKFIDLPFITAKAGDVYAWAKAEKLGVEAFGADVQQLFTDIENDITALEGKVGSTNVADQISAAVKAAIEGLDVTDAEVTGEFVVAVPQVDGKVAPARRALAATDIPELAQDKITGLTTRLGNIETAINNINDTEDGVLAQAKDYTDEKVKALADGRVAAAEAKLETLTGADTVEGSVAKALKDAKAYTDTEVNNAKTAAAADAQGKANKALEDAQKYVDDAISAITGGETGSLKALEERIADAEEALEVINGADTVEGSLAKVAKDAAADVAAEELRASNAETALSGRLDTVEAFFEAALEDGDGQQVIDTLKEIQDYIKSDETGAAGMLASIKANTDALEVINSTDATKEGSLAKVVADAAKDVENEATRAKGEEARIEGLANAAQSAADKAQDEIDALELVVGTPTQGKTIVEMIAAAQTAATYNDTEVRGLIGANTQAITNEATRATGAENAIKAEIGVDAQGNYVALTGGHATLIAAINAANAGVSANAGEIQKNAQAIAAINHETTGILATAKGYTNTKIDEVNNTITGLESRVVKTVAGDDFIAVDSTDVNNVKLAFSVDVISCGSSAGLDAAATL